jgi:tetratricopeptide (TPR) repeat protein
VGVGVGVAGGGGGSAGVPGAGGGGGVAAELLRRVLERMPEGDSRREVMEAGLARVAFLLVFDEEVERVARPLAARTADPDRAAEASWLLGYALSRTGRHDEAAAVMSAALARPGLGGVWAARLRARQAMTLCITGQPDQAAELAERALADAERAGDRFAAGYALHALSVVAFFRRDRAGSLGRIDEALAVIGDDPQATDLRLLMLANRAGALGDLDRRAEAGPVLREALALAERVGTPRLGSVCAVAAEHYYEVGQWDDALAVLEIAAGLPGADEISIFVHGLAALIAGCRDDWDAAEEHLATVRDQRISVAINRQAAPWLLRARALTAERAGRPGEAVAVLAQCLDPGLAADMPYRDILLPALARVAMAAGDAAVAAAAAQAAEEEAGREPEPEPFRCAVADHCRGLADADPAPVLAAAAYFESGVRQFCR